MVKLTWLWSYPPSQQLYRWNKKSGKKFKNLNNIVRFTDSYATKKIIRILLILEKLNAFNPKDIQMEYLNRFQTYVHQDFIGLVILENGKSRAITTLKKINLPIILKHFNGMLIKHCKLPEMMLFIYDIIPFSKLIDVLEDEDGVKFVVHKQAKIHPLLMKNLYKVDIFNKKRSPDEEKVIIKKGINNCYEVYYGNQKNPHTDKAAVKKEYDYHEKRDCKKNCYPESNIYCPATCELYTDLQQHERLTRKYNQPGS